MYGKILRLLIRYKRRGKKPDAIEDQIDGGNNLDSVILARPWAYNLLCIWSCIETLILSILVIGKKEDYAENFLHGFCNNGDCDGYILKAILNHLAISILMIIGALNVSSIYGSVLWYLFLLFIFRK